ncbi:MAG TPA: AAC(3)-I family aminoglycoside N-acetyltransferase [Burkholderiaceae bacterium]|nr:AAC(3)-I family aminoglycoside N-acetyltransferase [Burkholderiaceae bacterium]
MSTTRVLGPDDVGTLRAMLATLGDAFEDRAAYADAQPDDAYLRALLARDTYVAIAALDGDRVVGGLSGYLLPKPEQARSEVYLYDLAVAATHRRRGIATALIDRLRDWAVERGAWVVYVQADLGDDPAIALYTKLGVREDVLHFDIAPRRAPPGG